MPDQAPRESAVSERLTHIRELWAQLQHVRDPKERALLEQRLRDEADAYKQATGRAFDN